MAFDSSEELSNGSVSQLEACFQRVPDNVCNVNCKYSTTGTALRRAFIITLSCVSTHLFQHLFSSYSVNLFDSNVKEIRIS